MRLFILFVIGFMSAVGGTMIGFAGFSDDEEDNPFVIGLVVCLGLVVVSSILLSVGFIIGNEKIVVSEETEKVSYSLIQSGRNYIEKDDGICTFSYSDENNDEVTVTAEVNDSNLVYDLQQEKPYVTIYETTKIQYPKWWFIRGQDEDEITYKYDIHLPIN